MEIAIEAPLGHLRRLLQVFSEVRQAQFVQTPEEVNVGWALLIIEIDPSWSQAITDWCDKYGLYRMSD